VGLMNNAVNPAFKNCLSSPKDRFASRHTYGGRFYQKAVNRVLLAGF
jgi:hypothetical protein